MTSVGAEYIMQSLLIKEYPFGSKPPKFQIGMSLFFRGHGIHLCTGMIYCLLPDAKGWHYYFHNDEDGELGFHEKYVRLPKQE